MADDVYSAVKERLRTRSDRRAEVELVEYDRAEVERKLAETNQELHERIASLKLETLDPMLLARVIVKDPVLRTPPA